jgi:hypothetical protein
MPDGHSYQCIECHKKEKAEYRKEHQDVIVKYRKEHKSEMAEYSLKSRYGITLEQKQQMYCTQSGICPCCKKVFSFDQMVVDHNHNTSKVRGLLCRLCNTGIGIFQDNIQVLTNAINYLIERD